MILLPVLALTNHATTQASHDLLDLQQMRVQEYKKIQDVRDKLLGDPKVTTLDTAIQTDPTIRSMGLDNSAGLQVIKQALGYRFDKAYSGYHPIDLTTSDPILSYAVAKADASGGPKFVTLKDCLKDQKLGVYKVKATITPLPAPGGPPAGNPSVQEVYVPTICHDDLTTRLKYLEEHPDTSRPAKLKFEIEEDSAIPVHFYEKSGGDFLVVLDKAPPQPLKFPDLPDFVMFRSSPQATQDAYTKKTLKVDFQPAFAVKDGDNLYDMEHYRRESFLNLQKLRDKVKAEHPTSADFPPEMLQTPEFKSTGLDLSNQQDHFVLLQALAFQPEGTLLKGYHPIDYSKDKAAQYTAVAMVDAKNNMVKSLKDAFAGQKLFLFKVQIEAANRAPEQGYIGPLSTESLDLFKKSRPDLKLTELKDQDVPLNIYTNSAGDVAFVMAFEPKDVLLIPPQPPVLLATDPLDTVKPLATPGPSSQQLVSTLHRVNVEFAIEK